MMSIQESMVPPWQWSQRSVGQKAHNHQLTLAMPSCDASEGASGRADVTTVSLAARVHCISWAGTVAVCTAAAAEMRR